ncbi:Putative cell wall binding repeat-containing protein [Lachnospiraceae bacterium NE2001]|nr:Putative cell wall binding repeat-containing protein [Lachnospiraceae bacterium NE2001]
MNTGRIKAFSKGTSKVLSIVLTAAIVFSLCIIPDINSSAGTWQENSTGWWYEESDGSYPSESWKQIDGNWYYFNSVGYMVTGWREISGTYYYFDSNGIMAADKWIGDYYVDASGAWTETAGSTGWVMKGGRWYYYNEDGSVKTGWIQSGRDWYYLDADGGVHTGWLSDGGDWYYMASDGKMSVDWIWDGSAWYLMSAEGKWINDNKIIYLTFDDGPGPYTQRLLNILSTNGVKATFFVTAAYPEYSYLIAQEYNAGHTVGVHTYTHNYQKIYASEAAYWSDFEKMENVIETQTGSRTNLFRFPGGSSNKVSSFNSGVMTRLTIQADQKGYKYFDWNVLSGDAGDTTSSAKVYENMVNGVKTHNESVILCHDIKDYTIDAIEDFIPWALSNGYTFLPLSENSRTVHHTVQN